MLRIVQYRYFVVLLHALVWSIVLSFPFFISSADSGYSIGPLPGLYFTLSGIVHAFIFYVNSFFFYPKLLNRKYWWLYVLSFILLLLVSVGVKNFILDTWFPGASPDARTHVLFPSVLVFIVSIFYSITFDKIRAEKLQKENEALQLGMELRLLRSQISPHFLFNILTNLVSLARKKSDRLEPSLLMLSGLMRYMLNDAAKKISLQQEVEYLESYISLQKMRFGSEVSIRTNIEIAAAAGNCYIEPMLLIPFVENAFKHGYSDAPFINIRLTVKEETLFFEVKNKFDRENDNIKDESPGIGLNNVRSRLNLLYPGRHELSIQEENNFFQVQLKLQLL